MDNLYLVLRSNFADTDTIAYCNIYFSSEK